MRKIFKEAVWDYSLGKVLTVLGTVQTVWAIVVLAKPEYGNIILPSIDNRVWYAIALAFVVAAFLRVLKVASDYKKQLEPLDNIRFVCDEERYKPCKEVQMSEYGEVEVYRVGVCVIGNGVVESLIIIPDMLERVDDNSHKITQVSQIKLHPMMGSPEPIYGGPIPSYYVDVFTHVSRTVAIFMCYDNNKEEPIVLPNGRYKLTLIARAKPKVSHTGYMLITMADGKINVEMKQRDVWGG